MVKSFDGVAFVKIQSQHPNETPAIPEASHHFVASAKYSIV
jgi:hypothetical protein